MLFCRQLWFRLHYVCSSWTAYPRFALLLLTLKLLGLATAVQRRPHRGLDNVAVLNTGATEPRKLPGLCDGWFPRLPTDAMFVHVCGCEDPAVCLRVTISLQISRRELRRISTRSLRKGKEMKKWTVGSSASELQTEHFHRNPSPGRCGGPRLVERWLFQKQLVVSNHHDECRFSNQSVPCSGLSKPRLQHVLDFVNS